jgi:choloylglycine hydrolase
VFWVDLDELDFKAGAPVKRLLLTGDEIFAGNVAKRFEPAEAFTFLAAAV